MGSGVRTGIPGGEANTRDVTAGFKDFYYPGPTLLLPSNTLQCIIHTSALPLPCMHLLISSTEIS